MVIIRISEGFGNQLFQYAAGKCIAEKYEVPFKLDISSYKNDTSRSFELEKLHIHINLASEEEVKRFIPNTKLKKVSQFLLPKKRKNYHKERFFHYDKSFRNIGPNVYLKGYFQSLKYFEPVTSIIKKEFQILPHLLENVLETGSQLKNTNSVSVHIRRGDYKNIETFKFHGVLDHNYYKQAMEIIIQRVPDVRFCFFSDEIEWVKENLFYENAMYISGQLSNNHFEDLYLMSQCKHNIIANSSFSWWGAWLNNNPEKIVIGPKRWFDEGYKDTYDVLPATWLSI